VRATGGAPQLAAAPRPGALVEAALRLAERAAARGFRGPDPYDGLWHPWPRLVVGGRRRRQVVMQIHARSPVDVRRLYRRRHPLIPKALGIFGSVGTRAHRLGGGPRAVDVAARALDLLVEDRSAGPRAWGYHWDMQTRWSFYRAGSPNAVVTAFAASGLLEAAAVGHRRNLDRALESARWALDELWVEPEGYFAYHPGRPANIHNASLLGAWLVHVALPGDRTAEARVARAVDRTLAAQRNDGSWPYGEGGSLGWTDSFHSGYVLSVLDRLAAVDRRIPDAVARGARHYESFFDSAGRARLWTGRDYPEDGHSAGTGLTTLALLHRRGLVDRTVLERVAARVLTVGLRGGHAVHRRYRWGATPVAYLRWCDAHVALGLVDAAAALAGMPDLAPARSERAAV
jgi:hypothetical protein